MKNYIVLFLLSVCSSVALAQEYSPLAIEKNDEAVKLMFHSETVEKAISLLNEAIAIDSSYVIAYGNKAQCFDLLGRKVEALQTVLAAEKYALNNAYYYQLKGMYLAKNGDKDAAHIAYGRAFTLFGEELKQKPTVNVFINYVYMKYCCDGKDMSDQEMESMMPATFTVTDRKKTLDLIKMVDLSEMKEILLTGRGTSRVEKTTKETSGLLPKQREDGAYFIVDELAEFPGGRFELNKYLNENFKCSAEYTDNNKRDIILVSFVIAADGNVQNPVITRSVGEVVDKEALRVISSMPKWIPAKVKGQDVAMVYNIPITF